MIFYFLIICLFSPFTPISTSNVEALTGAWETNLPDGTKGEWIFADDHFSVSWYKEDPAEFISTAGGKWSLSGKGEIELLWEFNTGETELVGKTKKIPYKLNNKALSLAKESWKQLDNGKPGALNGAWVITGRERDGEMSPMIPGARKTMKILSGTRFQWIAYNSETAEFSGTGGGTYTTEGGKYTENIEFFSRDNSRVGASLEFDFELKDGKWHHKGKSSKGEPIYEIWSTRKSLGI